ncbi:hypothetical protein D3C74_466610 [compost metagenome]
MEIGSMSALKYYVQSGLGMALVPESTQQTFPVGTIGKRLQDGPVDLSCGIACRTADYPLQLAALSLYLFLKSELAAQEIINVDEKS